MTSGIRYQRAVRDGRLAKGLCAYCGEKPRRDEDVNGCHDCLIELARRSRSRKTEVERLPAAEKRQRLDLGLALLQLVCIPNVPLTCDDIALWCGCSWQRIWQIEQRALRKLRKKLSQATDHEARDAVREILERRAVAA